jgi:hypothetical protein
VAKSYVTAGDAGFQINGTPLAQRKGWQAIPEATRLEADELLRVYYEHFGGDLRKIKGQLFSDVASKIPGAKEAYMAVRDAKTFGPSNGNLYTVEIPDEHIGKMLDWDKPLSEQPKIYAAIKEKHAEVRPNTVNQLDWPVWDIGGSKPRTAGEGYQILADLIGPEEASAYLAQRGIPGIRYLDAGSRGAKEGTRNIVLFDPSLAKIVKKE